MKRGRLGIIASILRKCHRGARKTQIIYGCNLSSTQANLYLHYMLDAKLLRKSVNPYMFYTTTAKGRQYLTDYRSIQRLLSNHATNAMPIDRFDT